MYLTGIDQAFIAITRAAFQTRFILGNIRQQTLRWRWGTIYLPLWADYEQCPIRRL